MIAVKVTLVFFILLEFDIFTVNQMVLLIDLHLTNNCSIDNVWLEETPDNVHDVLYEDHSYCLSVARGLGTITTRKWVLGDETKKTGRRFFFSSPKRELRRRFFFSSPKGKKSSPKVQL